jgi:hypothetical protein
MSAKNGYTLSEGLVVACLSAILIGSVIFVLTNATSYLLHADTMSSLQFDARIATRKMVSELGRTTLAFVTISQSVPIIGDDSIRYRLLADHNGDGVPDQISTGDPDWSQGEDITIALDTNSHNLIRSSSSGDMVIAHDVKVINFMSHTNTPSLAMNELRISLQVEKIVNGRSYTFDMVSVVTMRN